MIELNLLPDIKLEYLKAQRTRRLVLSIAVIASVASIALLLLLLSVDGLQKKHLSDLNNDIKDETQQLQGKPDINKILTVQNQLESLKALHDGKPDAFQLFGYLAQVTPVNDDLNNLTVDFTADSMVITGDSDSLSNVNQFVDTLKFTTYTTDQNPKSSKAFNNIVLAAFSLSTGVTASGTPASSNSKPATFTINLNYDPTIFDITQKVTLHVPSEVSTRSNINSPNDLFTAPGGKH